MIFGPQYRLTSTTLSRVKYIPAQKGTHNTCPGPFLLYLMWEGSNVVLWNESLHQMRSWVVGSTKTVITQLRDFRMEPPLRGSLDVHLWSQMLLSYVGRSHFEPSKGRWIRHGKTRKCVATRVSYHISIGRLYSQMADLSRPYLSRRSYCLEPPQDGPVLCLYHIWIQLIPDPFFSDRRRSGKKNMSLLPYWRMLV